MNNRIAELEEKLRRLDRERAEIQAQISRIQGHPESMVSSGQLNAEEEMRNLALFPEENPFPILRVDRNGVLLYANRASGKLLNQWQCTIEEHVPEFVMKSVSSALESGRNIELESRCGERDYSFALIPIIERGYVNFYGRDVTSHKRAEAELVKSGEFLKRSQEIARLGSWELDLVDNVLTWSDEVYRIFGICKKDSVVSYKNFLDAVHPEDRIAVDEAYSNSLLEGQNTYEIEHRIVLRDTGEIRYVHEKCEHLRDEHGVVICSLGMVHDITDLKEREMEIQRLNADLEARAAELEDANRELEAFNFTVAHDLRKPLSVIGGYCQVMEDLCDSHDERPLNYLREIEGSVLRMSQLIESLLDFSRLSHVNIVRSRVDLSLVAEIVAKELQLAEPDRRVDFNIETGIYVHGDQDLLDVVMHNLLGNAWKYSRTRDEVIIEVGTSLIDGVVTCYVRDNGIGFDQADADVIFAPFQRLQGDKDVAGFGIGLATVERIIRRHGGRIWTESEPGEGATFFFTLGD